MSDTIIQSLPAYVRGHLPAAPYFWNIDVLDFRPSGLFVRGWALPFFGAPGNVELLINDVRVSVLEIEPSTEVTRRYPWWPNADHARFTASQHISELGSAWREDKELRFEVRPLKGDVADAATYPDARVMHYRERDAMLPDAALLKTIGGGNAQRYEIGGRTLFHRFQNVLEQETGKRFADIGKILDWGAGPGRIAAHVVPELKSATDFAGADIVDLSVTFANEAIARQFKVCATDPPLPFEDCAFDLLYAYSVLTHIPGPMLRGWMAELARVLKPGALALVTTLGELAFAHLKLDADEAEFKRWQAEGVSDVAANKQLDETSVAKDYYRNTWLPEAGVRALSTGLFEVQRVVKNFYFYQDLFVLRRL